MTFLCSERQSAFAIMASNPHERNYAKLSMLEKNKEAWLLRFYTIRNLIFTFR